MLRLFAIPIAVVLSAATAFAVDLPDVIRDALKQSASDLSPCDITWTAKRVILSNDNLRAALKDHSRLTVSSFLVDFTAPRTIRAAVDGRRFYNSYVEHFEPFRRKGRKYLHHPNSWESAFNGKELFVGSGQELAHRDIMLTVDTLEHFRSTDASSSYWDFGYYSACGFQLPENVESLGKPPGSRLLTILANNDARIEELVDETRGDQHCVRIVIVSGLRRHVVCCDQDKAYAIVEWREQEADGSDLSVVSCSDFHKVDGRTLWLPHKCSASFSYLRINSSHVTEAPIYRDDYSVVEMRFAALPSTIFDLSYVKPGSVISDGRLPGSWANGKERVGYVVPSDPADLDKAIDAAIKGEEMSIAPRKPVWKVLFISLNAAVVLAIVLLIIIRRLRARKYS